VTGSHAIRGVTSRRTLLAASAVAVLAGCGEDEEAEVPPAADVLLRSLAAERALAAAASGPGVVRRVGERARERAERLASALSAAGGRPHDAPAEGGGDASAGEIVSRGRAALAAHVAALPSLEGPELRGLAADLVTGAAADVAILGDELDVPVADTFPGSGT
jgi:hypothetical protein